ncbi:hypothetical protein [Flavobacterium piscis]|uniref:Uncharacterized protein n=1 Tax=Flavobacterium piscis TaxID=1114874 RepID=A0ABU1YCV4_9FLAO|nr:hypothetical protein [Flavobacterium piscis]MDR7212069.1 hypothetical protein [Flavobacterium piscis]
MKKQNIPPADAPNLDGPYDYAWFKIHHLENLKTQAEAITNFYEALPEGEGLTQENITDLFVLMDQFIEFLPWLPVSAGGQDDMKDFIKYRKKIKSNFQGKQINDDSYWEVQEIEMIASGIFDYMDAVCEDE